MENFSDDDVFVYFCYLDELLNSGEIDMFSGAQHLCEEFDMNSKEAEEVVTAWRESYDEE